MRYRVGLFAAALPVLAAGCGSTVRHSAVGPPRLILSFPSGRAGTEIRVEGVNCLPLKGERNHLLWYEKNAPSTPGSGQQHRNVPLVRTGETIRATFRILPTDTLGRGTLVLVCGGGRGNAVGHITVKR